MELSEEHIMIRETVRKFTEKEIIPIAEKMDRDDYFPEDFFKKWAELGILGITIPEEYGGIGADSLAQVLIAEELAKGSGAPDGGSCPSARYGNAQFPARNGSRWMAPTASTPGSARS